MNKIHNINLGGVPIVIDEDAYHKLDKYLTAIEDHFSASEGCDEIMADIEIRIAELLTENLGNQSIVTKKHLETVIGIMGRPEEFGAEGIDLDEEPKARAYSTSEEKRKAHSEFNDMPKRLFRDPDNKIVGGVCSGLSAYFGFGDPLWLRLIFVAGLFMGGASFLAYILLWMLIPKARTASDKLAMHGEPINIGSIAKKVEEEVNNLSSTINDIAKDYQAKRK